MVGPKAHNPTSPNPFVPAVPGWRPHFSRHNLTVDEFIAQAALTGGAPAGPCFKPTLPPTHTPSPSPPPTGSPTFKYDAHFSNWGLQLAADANTHKLVPAEHPILYHPIHEPYLWWGSQAAVTPMHYDNYVNFYVQVGGVGSSTNELCLQSSLSPLPLSPLAHRPQGVSAGCARIRPPPDAAAGPPPRTPLDAAEPGRRTSSRRGGAGAKGSPARWAHPPLQRHPQSG